MGEQASGGTYHRADAFAVLEALIGSVDAPSDWSAQGERSRYSIVSNNELHRAGDRPTRTDSLSTSETLMDHDDRSKIEQMRSALERDDRFDGMGHDPTAEPSGQWWIRFKNRGVIFGGTAEDVVEKAHLLWKPQDPITGAHS